MSRTGLLVALFVATAASGCLGGNTYSEPYAPPSPTAPTFAGTAWPDIADAEIRPGIRVITPIGEGAGQCTANFLFRSADNSTLYIGVAAHCFGIPGQSEIAPIGTPVQYVRPDQSRMQFGRIAFNGWEHNEDYAYDFGLIEISNAPNTRGRAHPAVLHFGGPTGLADGDAAIAGTKVITYGHSGQRGFNDPDNPREGWVVLNDGSLVSVVTDHPGIQGDSGSGLMTTDARALGVLSTGTINPTAGAIANRDFPSVNNYVLLDDLMQFVRQTGEGGLSTLELVTWEQIRAGDLPVI